MTEVRRGSEQAMRADSTKEQVPPWPPAAQPRAWQYGSPRTETPLKSSGSAANVPHGPSGVWRLETRDKGLVPGENPCAKKRWRCMPFHVRSACLPHVVASTGGSTSLRLWFLQNTKKLMVN